MHTLITKITLHEMKILPNPTQKKFNRVTHYAIFHLKLNHRIIFLSPLNPLKVQYFIAEMTLSDSHINETVVIMF